MQGHEVLFIVKGQYYIKHRETRIPSPDLPAANRAKRLYPEPTEAGGILVYPATFDGPVDVTVETFDAPPERLPEDGTWELFQEVTMVAMGFDLAVVTMEGAVEELPVLLMSPGDRYRVRLYGRGITAALEASERDDHYEFNEDDQDEVPLEFHLFHWWRER